jgi:hypothetical protein
MVQVRKPDGKFGGKATDVKKRDVDAAIRLVMDETFSDVGISFRKPLQVSTRARVEHSLGFLEFIVYAMLGVALTFIAIVGTIYLTTRLVP